MSNERGDGRQRPRKERKGVVLSEAELKQKLSDPEFLSSLRKVAGKMSGHDSPEDLVQRAIARALHAREQFFMESPSSLKSWVARILKNEAYNTTRKLRVHDKNLSRVMRPSTKRNRVPAFAQQDVFLSALNVDSSDASIEHDLLMKERFAKVNELVPLLTEQQQEFIRQMKEENVTKDGVAEALGIAKGTAGSGLSRARQALRVLELFYDADNGMTPDDIAIKVKAPVNDVLNILDSARSKEIALADIALAKQLKAIRKKKMSIRRK